MAVTQIADVIVPAYQVETSLVSTALFQSRVAVENGEMASQLSAGTGGTGASAQHSNFRLLQGDRKTKDSEN